MYGIVVGMGIWDGCRDQWMGIGISVWVYGMGLGVHVGISVWVGVAMGV